MMPHPAATLIPSSYLARMQEDLFQLNALIHKEADEILYGKGLFGILENYGRPHISGSYALDLMTWRDLDLYLETSSISESAFFKLGSEVAERFHPVKMSYRNECSGRNKELPKGLYWGVYLGNERQGAWKIDIWAVEEPELRRLLSYCHDLKDRISSPAREIILHLKSRCWQHPEYRRSFLSTDIYDAVLNKGITNYAGFEVYLKQYVYA